MPTPNITVLQGNVNTGTENSSVHVRDVDPKLYYLEAFKYPLVSALMTQGTELEKQDDGKMYVKGAQVKKVATSNVKFEHTESELLNFAFSPTAAVTTGASSITISTSDDDYFVAGMDILLTNADGQQEVARVTAVGAGSLTVTRNVGSTGAIAMTTADKLYIMGVIRAEDSTSTESRQAKSETLYNYCEFISEPYGVTNIEQATKNYHGDPLKRKKMEAFARMKQKLEMMFWCGVRDVSSSTTNPIYRNGGILYWLRNQFTNVPVTDVSGVLTKDMWEEWLQDVLKYNSMTKWVFCSSPVLTAVSGFASNQLRPADVNLNKFGMAITEYQSPFGKVYLVREPLFDEISSLNGMAVCLDMSNVLFRYLEGNGLNLDIQSYEDIQENDRSARKGEYRGVVGIDVRVGKSHGILLNVQR